MATARVAEPGGSLQKATAAGLTREELLRRHHGLPSTSGVHERGEGLRRRETAPISRAAAALGEPPTS